jgi:hypothetical protein
MNELLIFTNSYDATTDLLLSKLTGTSVFRLNFDQILQYKISFDATGFRISDPTGRTVNSQTIRKGYWRKPFSAENPEQELWTGYVEAEMRYLLGEMVNLMWAHQKLVLVEPFAERRAGKLMQLRCAEGVFTIPSYEFVLGQAPRAEAAVVKSLSSETVGGKVLYTTRISAEILDTRYPWFVEQYVAGTHDVTVVFVRGQLFAFSLQRDFLQNSIDWREFMFSEQRWTRHTLPSLLATAIVTYMRRLKLDFGRLDFLLDEQKRYWFCEVNPNGQFAWLDLTGDEGVLDAVVQEISPTTPCHPISSCHPIETLPYSGSTP